MKNSLKKMPLRKKLDWNYLFLPDPWRSGDRHENITKSYGDRVLYKDLTIKIPRNAIVGIIGHNGVGKSTLFRMITGQEKPDSGDIIIGESVKIAYVDQSHEDLVPEKSVYEAISNGLDNLIVNGMTVNSQAYISKFNFNGTDQK
jgi:ATPase subunit of ABC transporter with duplicated ATPase domains